MFLEIIRELLLLIFVSASLCPVAFFWPCSQCCIRCSGCSPEYGGTFQVDLSGMVNDGCTNCGELNGTYILTRLLDTAAIPFCSTIRLAEGCAYYYIGTPTACNHTPTNQTEILLNIFRYTGPATTPFTPTPTLNNYYVQAQIVTCRSFCDILYGSGGRIQWEADLGAIALDCSAFENLEIPLFNEFNGCFFLEAKKPCDSSNASFRITAIAE